MDPRLVWLPTSWRAMASITSRRPRASRERAFSPMTKKLPVAPTSVMVSASHFGMSSMPADSGDV